MLNSKYIQIRKERSIEQRLASIWLDACSELEIPCILIYEGHWNAYISVNLKFIPDTFAQNLEAATEHFSRELALIQQKYTAASDGYCNHNKTYHTFDSIPKEVAKQVAAEIFDTLMSYSLPENKPELVEETSALMEQNYTA
jgi:hypothetical protein